LFWKRTIMNGECAVTPLVFKLLSKRPWTMHHASLTMRNITKRILIELYMFMCEWVYMQMYVCTKYLFITFKSNQ
jgi:hypothetical protein